MDGLKQWFKNLSERERYLVIGAGIMTLVALFYLVIWAPLNNAIDTNRAGLNSDRELNTWLEEQANRAILLRQGNQSQSFSGSLTQVINQTTRNAGISVSRMQPQGEELQVWIDAVPFNDLMQWLNNLEQRGVVIVQSDISETDEQGIVQVRRLQLGKL
ncbi:type II secretion system protein GspM [Glaciecola sp. 1036]|uniref:type II secretion system protein GspM n=1 Tax=Alteromonadaceae TaxID=72275 RepID=UPI003D092916